MAEVITGDTSINKLLEEQKVTSQHLELFKGTNDATQDLLLEQMVSNEELSTMNEGIQALSKSIEMSIKSLSGKVEDIDLEQAAVESKPMFDPATAQFVPIAEDTNSLLESGLKNDAMMLKLMESMADSSGTLAKVAESAEDVAGVETLPTGKPEDAKEDEGVGGLFDLLSPKKAFGALGKKFPKLGKFGKLLGKGLKFLGPIAAVGMSLFEFAKGVENASEITGKPMESLSTLEKAGAGLAGVVEGITFGLIDAKDAYSGIESIAETISSFGKDIFNMMPDSVQKGLTSAVDFLFNADDGIFGFMSKTFESVINSLAKGEYVDAGLELLKGNFLGVFGPDGFLVRSWSALWSGAKALASTIFDALPSGIQQVLTDFASGVSSTFSSIFVDLPISIAENVSTFAVETTAKFKNFFTGIPDAIEANMSGIKETMTETVTGLFESITDLIPKSIKDIAGGISGFFGFGDDDDASKTIAEKGKPKEKGFLSLGTGDEETQIVQSVQPKEKENGFFNGFFGSEDKEPIISSNRFDSSIKRRANQGVPQEVNTDAITFSKQRMEEGSKTDGGSTQPIIIKQDSAPPPKKTMTRTTSIGDTELAMMNTNMLDA